ncbi:helix-turn-helix domain-containing protein [Nocardia cyriacigeorgica]|uniref:helix-turn-helix domain-containing protein n=1 Tax=Nocardia cyriacigeorgica TaxID=135487 RepID=UPI0024567A2F|nr:helix-turn-helix transcriptional regulator [Nocardia cyriacigeorgica]
MTASSTMANSTLPRRILAGLLREKRIAAGISVEAARQAIGVSKQTFWRMETGQPTKINPLFISHLAQMYRVDARDTEVLLGLTEETHAKGWWHAFGEAIPKHFDLYVGLEDAAKSFSSYHTMLLPGLLQTMDYRREVIWAEFPGMTTEEVDLRLELHKRRLERLHSRENPLQLNVLLDESVLRRRIGSPQIMADQLNHLLATDQLPHVSIRVVPLDGRRHKGVVTGHFVILEFPNHPTANLTDPPVIYIQGFTGALYLDKRAEFEQYRDAYADIQRVALDETESRRCIQAIAEEWVRER